jgi:dTDP-4-dehydrorhamnose 3,5-epimerase
LVSQYYSKNNEYGLLWNDSDIGIDWPLTPMIISEKDRDNYSFSYLDKEIL